MWVDLEAGARTALLGPIGPRLLIAGLIGLVVGIPLLLFGAAGLGRDIDRPPPTTGPDLAATGGIVAYPLSFVGYLDRPLSRWLWLVKWLLVIPHLIVLAVLSFAQLITTIAAGFAILFTGRYPRPWFVFSVGVLRWSWRVGFYAYLALGLLVLIAAIALLFTGHYLPGVFPLVIGINRWAFRVSTYAFLLRDEYPPFRLDQGPTDSPPRPLIDDGPQQPNT